MTRGNQREEARKKNLKKQQDQAKGGKKDGALLQKTKERDADIMRIKQQKALEKKEQEQGATGGKWVVRPPLSGNGRPIPSRCETGERDQWQLAFTLVLNNATTPE